MGTRETIVDHLQTIASAERVRQYQEDVPYAEVAWELYYTVFRDNCWSKAPNDGGLSEEECDSIDAFRRLFNDRVDQLPMDKGIERLLKSEGWREIQAQAQNALEVMQVSMDST